MPTRHRTPAPLEDALRALIETHTRDRGRRADLSRQLGHPRGWLTEYLTGKIKHLKIDEIAAVLSLLEIDGEQLRSLPVIAALVMDADTTALWRLWQQVTPEHRATALDALDEVADLSQQLRALREERARRRAARAPTRAAPQTPGDVGRRPTEGRRLKAG